MFFFGTTLRVFPMSEIAVVNSLPGSVKTFSKEQFLGTSSHALPPTSRCSWKEAPVGLCSWTGTITQWFRHRLSSSWASLLAQTVKNLPAMQETWAWSLGREDPLEEERATHPVFLPGKPRGRRSLATVHGVTKSRAWLSNFFFEYYLYSDLSVRNLFNRF